MSELDASTAAIPEPSSVLDTAGGPIPRARATPLLTHGGITTQQFRAIHIMGVGFPLVAGLALYGWRALLTICIVLSASAGALAMWRHIGRRGEQLRYAHTLWLALLLALTLPAHLLSDAMQIGNHVIVAWPILPAAAILLVMISWVTGGPGSGRIHPVVLAQLLVVLLAGELLVPHAVLQQSHIFFGDVLKSGESQRLQRVQAPWNSVPLIPGQDAVRSEPASQLLTSYTSGMQRPQGSFLSLEALLRDHMPPLEDLIVGGAPGPIGTSSAIAVIIGGMFLMYRGVIDYRIPLLIFLAAIISLLVLPIPVAMTETTRSWHWLAVRHPDVTLPIALTFANYEVMASPLLFVAFFLATEPSVRPMARRARAIYAILIGVASASLQLYCSVRAGPYLAAFLVGLVSPLFDRMFGSRTLV
jgi:Na+-translocating ferredoxin:NAD+ oxidoreductase RnfD subunit